MNTFQRCLVASVATTVVAMGGVLPAAIAQENPTDDTTNTQQQTATYSLTIHKRIGAAENVEGYDGSELETGIPGADAPAGFEFSITQVTPAKGADMNNASKATVVPGGHTATGKTGADGKIKFENLPAGVYRVHEDGVPDPKYVPGPDFLVSVPATAADGKTSINDVVVYPKNTEAGVTKEVKDADAHGGHTYDYTITASIPAPASDKDKLVSYRVTDALDGKLEAPKAEDITVELTDGKDGAQTLTADDYEVKITAGSPHDVQVIFKDTAMGKLEAARKAGQSVKVGIKAKAPADVKVIPNKSTLYFNNGVGTGEHKRDSNEVKTYWGKLNIKKTDSADKSGLKDAEFQLVRCEGDKDKGYKATGKALTVNGQSKWTTNEKGEILITGIHASDFADGKELSPIVQYCAQETKAPKGFQLDNTLIPFILTKEAGDAQRDGDTNGAYTYGINMENHKTLLPNTGGIGIGLLVVLGMLVIGGGTYVARRNTSAA